MSKTSITEHEIQSLANFIESMRLEEVRDLPGEFHYPSLPLCVIDAVFSIGVRYISTWNTVNRFCDRQGWNIGSAKNRTTGERSVSDLLKCFSGLSPDVAAKTLFGNRQRAYPSKSAPCKAEAVRRFAKALREATIHDFPDLTAERLAKAEGTIRTIPGQRSGISFDYFLMLAGNEQLIKPDRQVKSFIGKALSLDPKKIKDDHARTLLQGAVQALNKRGATWSPRRLDYAIWDKERRSDKRRGGICPSKSA